jgi:hypothetical protein
VFCGSFIDMFPCSPYRGFCNDLES